MYTTLKAITGQLLMPGPVLLGLLLLGLVLLTTRRKAAGWALAFGAGLALCVASWAPVADRWLGPLEAQYPVLEALPEEVQAVVVLGGGWQPGRDWGVVGRLNDSSRARLMEGIRVWRLGDFPLIVTGTSPRSDQGPIAVGYAEAAVALGVPPQALITLTFPTDTGQEARAVAAQLGEGARVVLVTSASHMPRAMAHFRAAGLVPEAAPTQFLAGRDSRHTLGYWLPASRHLEKSERAWYELLGRLALRWE
ncbi:ElyC/SanA/YdcF family protein [Isoalcanivorax indicus]|uniref:ElyC/SanA/YdcF family protein n=1 Tax=Isoalcanivorax indicus TaxID=2202653 RepID=UPI000DBA620B|nr:ElyC/SanA/YdcF family protein [Isoalcanivorax indicus]